MSPASRRYTPRREVEPVGVDDEQALLIRRNAARRACLENGVASPTGTFAMDTAQSVAAYEAVIDRHGLRERYEELALRQLVANGLAIEKSGGR